MKPGVNEFFDINKLPSEKGLLFLPLSISNLSTKQTAQKCVDFLHDFSPSKISKPLVGANFVYGDFLYLNSEKPASELKNSFMHQIVNHKNSLQNIIEKKFIDFQIQHAFSYMVWNQLYLGTDDFGDRLNKLRRIYESDDKFKGYVKQDCEQFGREISENQITFFLEESLMFYLIAHNQVKLPNDYIENHQKWILVCYPGKPPKSVIYTSLLNLFELNWPENPYQNAFYDLSTKKLIEFDRVDLENYKYND